MNVVIVIFGIVLIAVVLVLTRVCLEVDRIQKRITLITRARNRREHGE